MLKKVALFIAAVSVILIVAGIFAFRPTRWEKAWGNESRRTVETYDRHWEFLPLSDWKTLPTEIETSEDNGTLHRRSLHFGFVALSECHSKLTMISVE